jgi:hypothetical protein
MHSGTEHARMLVAGLTVHVHGKQHDHTPALHASIVLMVTQRTRRLTPPPHCSNVAETGLAAHKGPKQFPLPSTNACHLVLFLPWQAAYEGHWWCCQ